MDNVYITTEAILNLRLDRLPNDWVQTIWENDFLDIPNLPLEVEELLRDSVSLGDCLSQLHDVLGPWAEGQESPSGQGFWTILSDNTVTVKGIVVLLFYLMVSGQKRSATVHEKITGSIASAIYFLLLRISGSGAYKVFNNCVFEKSLATFKVLSHSVAVDTNKRRTKGNQGHQAKRRRVQRDVEPSSSAEEDQDEEEDNNPLRPQEIHQLKKTRIGLLKDFVIFIQSYQLDDAGLGHTLQLLVHMTTQEPNTFGGIFDDKREIEDMNNVPELAYTGLKWLISADRGNRLDITTSLLRLFMPSILMLTGQNLTSTAQVIPQSLHLIRDHTAVFVCHLLKKQLSGLLGIVRTFLQNICVKVPDKTDYRTKVSQAILTIMDEIPTDEYARFIEWIIRYSKNAKIPYRIFALDLISGLLEEQKPSRDTNSIPAALRSILSHKHLLEVIVDRCSDISPSVRSRAISAFVQCSSSKDPHIMNAVCSIVTPKTLARPPTMKLVKTPGAPTSMASDRGPTSCPEVTTDRGLTLDEDQIMEQDSESDPIGTDSKAPLCSMATVEITPAEEISLSDNSGVISMLRRRCNDDKINVRKSALVALEAIIRLEGYAFSSLNLSVIEERCRDSALSVRKQAMQSLNILLHELPESETIQRSWLGGLLPMVSDGETSVQSKCLELLEETIFHRIVSHQRQSGSQQILVWKLLKIIAAPESMDFKRYLQKACQHWGKAGSIPKDIVHVLRSHIGTENNEAAWLLLMELSAYLPRFNTEFILDYWNNHAKKNQPTESNQAVLVRVVTVLGRVAKNISPEKTLNILDDLKSIVIQFTCPPDLTTAMIVTLNKIADNSEDQKQHLHDWFGDLLGICDQYLSSVILNENHEDAVVDEERLVQHLFTLGEVTQLCPEKTPKRVYMLVQSIIAASTLTSGAFNSDTLPRSQGSQGSLQILSQFRGSNMSPRVRAVAFITLGKLCLQNEAIAKACVPAMARELEISSDLAVRNNVVIVLCDLCIRYTLLVDRYIDCISACLRDEFAVIRHQSLILLTRLLQEDYIKWKGSLFYRFVISIVDNNPAISEFAKFCLLHVLLQRHQNLYFNHFVECIFYFNSYTKHPTYNNFNESEREVKLFSLKGDTNAEKRMTIYKFLLENMSDGQRFQVMEKLIQEVLVSFVDEVIPLDMESGMILRDALCCLASKEIKLAMLRSRPTEEMVENEEEVAAAVVNAAKKTIISQVMKRTVMESTVPVMISLKHMLEKHHSSILKEYMMYLRELMKDYKNEVKEVLGADKQLATEIEFDLRRFEENQTINQTQRDKNQTATVQQAGHPVTPVVMEPRTPTFASPQRVAETITPMLNSSVPVLAKTPSRRMSMATLAIINSARKFLTQTRLAANVQKTPQHISAELQKEAAEAKENLENNRGQAEKTGNFVQPTPTSTRITMQQRTKNTLRAISTPAASSTDMNNVTFCQGDNNLSMIAPPPFRSQARQRNRAKLRDLSPTSDIFEDSDSDSTPILKRKPNQKKSQLSEPIHRLSRLSLSSSEERPKSDINSSPMNENDENSVGQEQLTRHSLRNAQNGNLDSDKVKRVGRPKSTDI